MNNFYSYNPTKIIFGTGMIPNIAREIPADSRVMIVYGGGSVKENGVLDQVKEALAGYATEEFSGIEPNPEYGACISMIEKIREFNADFLLAVGGGSVIDATKFAALGYYADGDPWDFVEGSKPVPGKALPFGCIQTYPASGSEMNNACVISRRETGQKEVVASLATYPRFSVLDPSIPLTLSPKQLAHGIVDIFIHVLEQYVTYPCNAYVQERQAEALLLAIKDVALRVIANPADYQLMSNLMWSAPHAVNGVLSRGVPVDWSTHEIGHMLTACYGITHAESIALVLPGVWRDQFENKKEKLAQYGRRVWGLDGGEVEVANGAIAATEAFFHSMDVPTTLTAHGLDAEEAAETISRKFKERGKGAIGERNEIDSERIKQILQCRV